MLRQAVSGRPHGVRLAPDDGPALVVAAATHRVSGYVHRALHQPGGAHPLDPETTEQLAALATRAVAGHLRTLADLRRLQSLLDGRGVRWCVFKGPAAVELLHGDAGLRSYSDLDVLVAAGDLADVLAWLEASGAQVLDAHWQTLVEWQHTQIHLRLWSGTTLDLHWHLINEWYDRDAFALDTYTLLGRVRRVDLAGVRAATLDPSDTLVNLCVHAATAGGQRLCWLRDIQLAARAPGIDWEVVAGRTTASGTALVTATMLSMAAIALGDRDLLAAGRRLTPSVSWVRLAVAVAHLSPAARWRGHDDVTLGWVLCRSTRQSVRRSAVIVLRNSTRLLRRWTTSERLRTAVRPLWQRLRDPAADPLRRSVLPGDGPHRRGAYLDWAASSVDVPPTPSDAGRRG